MGKGIQHSDSIHPGDTRLVMHCIEAELAAIAAKEGVCVAERVAESCGIKTGLVMAILQRGQFWKDQSQISLPSPGVRSIQRQRCYRGVQPGEDALASDDTRC